MNCFKLLFVLLLITALALADAYAGNNKTGIDPQKLLSNSGVLFIENKGQVRNDAGQPAPEVLFTATSNGMQLFFTRNGVSYVLLKAMNDDKKDGSGTETKENQPINKQLPKIMQYRIDMELLNSGAEITADDPADEYFNFFNSEMPVTNVKAYKRITYRDVYPNIDLTFYDSPNGLKYDFIVKPGGDVSLIKMQYNGTTDIRQADNKLLLGTPFGYVAESIPETYQNISIKEDNGLVIKKRNIACNYKIDRNVIGFDVDEYDRSLALTIDPIGLKWVTFNGGTNDEVMGNFDIFGNQDNGSSFVYFDGGLDISPTGSIVMAGSTLGGSYIYNRAYGGGGDWDVFVTKYRQDGSRAWTTMIRSSATDRAGDVAVDGLSNIVVVGATNGSNFYTWPNPYPTPFQGTCGSCYLGLPDGFATKLDSNGFMVASTFLGGYNIDMAHSVSIERTTNSIVIVGETYGANFPGINTYSLQGIHGSPITNPDVFILRLTSNLRTPLFSTYYGGIKDDIGLSVYIQDDSTGNYTNDIIYVTGTTNSINFPQNNNGFMPPDHQSLNTTGNDSYTDAFIIKMNGMGLIPAGLDYFGVYYGGARDDFGTGITMTEYRGADYLYIAGYTESDENQGPADGRFYITQGPAISSDQTYNAFGDAFVSCFQSMTGVAPALYYAFYLGGEHEDRANDIYFCKGDGTLNIVGYTNSQDLPLVQFNQRLLNLNGIDYGLVDTRYDAFVSKFTLDGNSLFTTFYGGSEQDFGIGIVADNEGYIRFAGTTDWDDIPMPANNTGDDQTFGYGLPGNRDAFLVAYGESTAFPTYYGGSTLDTINDIALDRDGYVYITGTTNSYNLPRTIGTVSPYLAGYMDIFIAKYTNNGHLLFSTYYGGTSTYADQDYGIALAVDDSAIYVTGSTCSDPALFARVRPGYICYQNWKNGISDSYLLSMNKTGTQVNFCTYLGGDTLLDGLDGGSDITVRDNFIYLTGYTSPNNPACSVNPDVPHGSFLGGASDAYIAKFSTTGALLWCTYWGGVRMDAGMGIAISGNDEIAITGVTSSPDFELYNNPYQSFLSGLMDPFFSVFTDISNNLDVEYSTYFGGSRGDNRDSERATAIAAEYLNENKMYITGYTNADMFPPASNGYQTSRAGEFDGFIIRFIDPFGNGNWSLDYGTLLGGTPTTSVTHINDIASTTNQSIYVTGSSDAQLPLSYGMGNDETINKMTGYKSSILLKFNLDLSNLLAGTYYEGMENTHQVGTGIAIADNFKPIVCGYTTGAGLPEMDPTYSEQPFFAGDVDGFIVKFNTMTYITNKERTITLPEEPEIQRIEIAGGIINIYPNPVADLLTINYLCKEKSNVRIVLSDLLGNEIGSWQGSSVEGSNEKYFNLEQLPAGTYLIVISINGQTYTRSIVKS